MGVLRKVSLSKPPEEAGKSWPGIVIGFFVAFGGVLFGYDTGTISGIIAMPYWQNTFSTGYRNPTGHLDITTSQESAIVSILSAGTFFGALSSPFLADYIGRRPALMVATWIFNIGVIFQTASTSIPLFLAGRFFAGFGVGEVSALNCESPVSDIALSLAVPLYQSETAPKWIRGAIVGAYQLAITIGLLLAAVVNNATSQRMDTGSYRIPIAVQFAWSLILFTGLIFLPETPRYLIRRDKPKKAMKSLGIIRRLPADHPAIQQEYDEIKASHEYELSIGKSSYIDCFRPPILKRQFTGMALQALQQLTGINFIFYYGTKYFQNSGVSSGFVIQMITSAINVASTIPGLYAIDKWGRRPLLLWGAVGMCVSQFIVAMTGTLTSGQFPDGVIYVKNLAGQQAAVAFVCIFIFFFASTWGPLAWVVTGEIFPLKCRARSLSMTTATNWLFNWAIAYSTPYLVNFGPGFANLQSKIFFIWFGCCFICIAFVYFFIYETKGLTLEEIDLLYTEVKSARKSRKWRPDDTWVHRQSVAHQGAGGEDSKAVNGDGHVDASHHEKNVEA
ncbi:putative glucose transporter rco-3 [Tolypocladium ophioglossoides CBS 100239]|uniref:Putative glucose transporter rco-3 n=1 Tax=Tolypocladium ophioglossoides (strain CBS 100239) TaxID=1163406 RepID=A0A0L0N1I0_TOLOC|nr:putative glucose transporter rco-3 [Tolypocladium ophioglossoides CBS 100239]